MPGPTTHKSSTSLYPHLFSSAAPSVFIDQPTHPRHSFETTDSLPIASHATHRSNRSLRERVSPSIILPTFLSINNALTNTIIINSVLAAPQFGPPGPPSAVVLRPHPGLQFGPRPPPTFFFGPNNCFSPNPFIPDFTPPGIGGDNNGDYHGGCTCQVFGDVSPDIGRDACNNLGLDYPNLVWDECNKVVRISHLVVLCL